MAGEEAVANSHPSARSANGEERPLDWDSSGGLDDYPDVEPLLLSKTWERVISERSNTGEVWETLSDGEVKPGMKTSDGVEYVV